MKTEPKQNILYRGSARMIGNDLEIDHRGAVCIQIQVDDVVNIPNVRNSSPGRSPDMVRSARLDESRVLFGPGIAMTDLDIVHRGPHLIVNVHGIDNALVIHNVRMGKIPTFVLNDGTMLTGVEVDRMARVEAAPSLDWKKT